MTNPMPAFVTTKPASLQPLMVLDAPHAAGPDDDPHTGEIVETAGWLADCHTIIAQVSRQVADLNRERDPDNADAVDAHRRAMRDLLGGAGLLDAHGHLTQPVLHLSVYGMKDRGWAVEIGTAPYDGLEACSAGVRDWLHAVITDWLTAPGMPAVGPVVTNKRFIGDPSLLCHRHGDPDPAAKKLDTLLIEAGSQSCPQ